MSVGSVTIPPSTLEYIASPTFDPLREKYDVIIIGSGAGGGTLTHKLAPSGKKILILERGGYVPREKDNWNPRAVNLEGKYQTKEIWHDKDGKELHPHTNYYVGGNTKFFGAALFRLRKEDFGQIKHHGGLSPAWPITYNHLEPYYTEAERLYHVHGNAGEDRLSGEGEAAPRGGVPGNLPMTSKASACARSTRRSASCSMSKIRTRVNASAAEPATASPVSSMRRRIPRCAPSTRHCKTQTSR